MTSEILTLLTLAGETLAPQANRRWKTSRCPALAAFAKQYNQKPYQYITSTIKSTIKVNTLKYNWSNSSVNLCQSSLSVRCLVIQTCSKPNQLIQNANTTLKSTKTIKYRCKKYNYYYCYIQC